MQVKQWEDRCILTIHQGYTWCKQITVFIYIIIASCLILLFHYCQWEGHYTMIYSSDCFHASHVQYMHPHIPPRLALRSYACTERTEGALTLSRESITHSAAYFGGSKDHTPLCARVPGHVLKMYPLTNTSVWYIRKTNADLHSPEEHFRHLHQKYPERHKNRNGNWLHIFFYYFCNQMKYTLHLWNETTRDENRYLTTS